MIVLKKLVGRNLTNSLVSVNTCIPGGSGQVFTLTVGDMCSIRVSIAFGKTEINHIYTVLCGITSSNKEIVWFNVSMNNTFFMDLLNSLDLYSFLTTLIKFTI